VSWLQAVVAAVAKAAAGILETRVAQMAATVALAEAVQVKMAERQPIVALAGSVEQTAMVVQLAQVA
jgi:hypothetical protein